MGRVRPKCVLIDGNSLLYRAFYAIRFLSTRDGRPTNALYGFASMLLKLMADEEPDAMLVAFDAPAKTFRHEEFADYKATRKPTPDELKLQSPVARDLAARSPGLRGGRYCGHLCGARRRCRLRCAHRHGRPR